VAAVAARAMATASPGSMAAAHAARFLASEAAAAQLGPPRVWVHAVATQADAPPPSPPCAFAAEAGVLAEVSSAAAGCPVGGIPIFELHPPAPAPAAGASGASDSGWGGTARLDWPQWLQWRRRRQQ